MSVNVCVIVPLAGVRFGVLVSEGVLVSVTVTENVCVGNSVAVSVADHAGVTVAVRV